MKVLRQPWFAGLMGALLYVATTAVLLHPFKWAKPPQGPAATRDAKAGLFWNASTPEIDQLLAELKKEKEMVGVRQRELTALAQQLGKQRDEINQATQMVHRLRLEFDKSVVRVQDEEIPNLKKLAKVYALMDADGAANILKSMEDDQIVRFLVFMKETEAAPLLEALAKQGEIEAKRVAVLSERLRLSVSRTPTSTNARP